MFFSHKHKKLLLKD